MKVSLYNITRILQFPLFENNDATLIYVNDK